MEIVVRTPIGEGIAIVAGYRQLTSRLKKHQSQVVRPVMKPSFGICSGMQTCGSLDKTAHSKKAFPTGKAFKLVAERTGLEPATPGVTGRYS
ncbi:hypothetical protein ACK348_16885, partial [Aeromonas veronii]|uniref:hypothetical protein n=1 Tax=Aeromonas veronii TaxID=654 RepID=UPI003A46D671